MKKKNIKKCYINIIKEKNSESYKNKTKEKYMNKNQLLYFKIILQKLLKKNQKSLELNNLDILKETNNFPDILDRAVQDEEFHLKLRNRDRDNKLIKKIKNTLKKIERKKYGFCEYCGIKIGIKRLEANPIANFCIDCKTIEEIHEKQISK